MVSSVLVLGLPLLSVAQTPTIAGCSVLPANNVWNTPINKMPVDKNSAAYIASMNVSKSTIYPVLNNKGWGMPYNVVPGSTPKVPVTFYYRDSDTGPYPIASSVVIQDGNDHHAIIVDTGNCVLYELFNLTHNAAGWQAGSGAIFPLNSNLLRRAGWTSADAAGLPIFPGMLRVEEVLKGHINHALRVTAGKTRNRYIWPARHSASSLGGSQYPPMGQRFRLKASFDISGYAPQARVILQALKTYGLILADNGPSWDLTGTGDPRWDEAAIDSTKRISGNNFEAIDESSLMVDPNSAQVSFTAAPLPTGWMHVTLYRKMCLEIGGGRYATQPTALTQQWECASNPWYTNQQFQFVPVKGGYAIKVRNSGLALSVVGGTSAVDGARIEQWGYQGASFQIWSVLGTATGLYRIRPHSDLNQCLAADGAYNQNGGPVVQHSCTTAANQLWSLTPVD